MWTDDDRDKVIAYLAYESERCTQCGTFPREWRDEDGYPIEPYEAYHERCDGCGTIRLARGEIPETDQYEVRTYLVPRKDEDELEEEMAE